MKQQLFKLKSVFDIPSVVRYSHIGGQRFPNFSSKFYDKSDRLHSMCKYFIEHSDFSSLYIDRVYCIRVDITFNT